MIDQSFMTTRQLNHVQLLYIAVKPEQFLDQTPAPLCDAINWHMH